MTYCWFQVKTWKVSQETAVEEIECLILIFFDKNNSFQFSAKNPKNLVSTTIAWFLVEKKPKIWNSLVNLPKISKKKTQHSNQKFDYQIPTLASTVLDCTNYFQHLTTFFSKTSTPISSSIMRLQKNLSSIVPCLVSAFYILWVLHRYITLLGAPRKTQVMVVESS